MRRVKVLQAALKENIEAELDSKSVMSISQLVLDSEINMLRRALDGECCLNWGHYVSCSSTSQ